MTHLATLDLVVVGAYALLLFVLAQWVSREPGGHHKDARDYFLASRSLPWWAIGASLIASNISAEQIIGMSGSAYVLGIAIAAYEWMAAITLIIVGKYLLPVFLQERIYTMPQFLEHRFDGRVRTVMAVFWIAVYVLVNLTSILWLGALAIHTVTGFDQAHALIVLGVFSLAYSVYGGLKAVALTDAVQVVLLVVGGLLVTWIALDRVADGAGAVAGFRALLDAAPAKFDLILSPDNPHYDKLPGLSVLIGGMWVMNLSYWGFNQYIIQRALAAPSTREAQKGIALAAFLKLLMPVIVVLPGVAAAVLAPQLAAPDQAYPTLMTLLPAGIKGLVFAGLIAAIVSSLASMTNSIATISVMDLYDRRRHGAAPQQQLVRLGRLVSVAAMACAMLVARPLLGRFDQAFQYIQEFTGFFTPGIVAIFLLGFFWKRATAAGALAAAIGSAVLSLALKLAWPALPFMDRVAVVFVLCCVLGVAVSALGSGAPHPKAIDYARVDTTTSRGFNLAGIAVALILAALYATWW